MKTADEINSTMSYPENLDKSFTSHEVTSKKNSGKASSINMKVTILLKV